MKRGKFEAQPVAKKNNGKKVVSLLLVLVLLVGAVVGTTLAWLQTKTNTITNTFTVGNISISLTETGAENNTKNFKLSPGKTHEKDPKVTVNAGSEACWLFVKIDVANNTADGLEGNVVQYAVDEGWTAVTGYEGVYYRVQAAIEENGQAISYSVLNGDKVTINKDLTAGQMTAMAENTPSLAFTAYAIQSSDLTDGEGNAIETTGEADVVSAAAAKAWALVSGN